MKKPSEEIKILTSVIVNLTVEVAALRDILRQLSERTVKQEQLVKPKSILTKSLTCPLCSSRMLLRKRKIDGNQFWGCVNYPNCLGSRDIDGTTKNKPPTMSLGATEHDETDEPPF